MGASWGLSDPAGRTAHILAVLQLAADRGVEFLVFPELSVLPDVRIDIAEWLYEHEGPLRCVVAGSFHEDADGRWVNRSVVLGPDGEELAHHDKMRGMRIETFWEEIHESREVTLHHGDAGPFGLAVCLDFFDENPSPVRALYNDLGCRLVAVPSMGEGPTVSAHRSKAEALRRLGGASTVMANETPDGHGGCAFVVGVTGAGEEVDDEDDAFACLSLDWTGA